MFSKKSYLTPNQVAELLMVSPSAIRLWAEKGELKATTTAGGHRRFKYEDIKEFANGRKIELNIPQDKNSRILIIDDEQIFASYLKVSLLLDNKDLDIEISLDGFNAGIKLKDFKPSIVLLDLKMPNMDGFQVCNQIKNDPSLKHIRVIAMSGNLSAKDSERILQVGAEACFEKPLNISLLTKHININEVKND